MADGKFLRTHRAWEDWLGIALGITIMLSPWLVNEIASSRVLANAALAGVAVLLLSELDLVAIRRWAEAALLACGIWVVAAPTVLGYGGSLRPMHFVLGASTALLAVFELWQRGK